MSNKLPPDPTLDEIRAFLAPHIAAHAAFDGWNEKAVEEAAEVAEAVGAADEAEAAEEEAMAEEEEQLEETEDEEDDVAGD